LDKYKTWLSKGLEAVKSDLTQPSLPQQPTSYALLPEGGDGSLCLLHVCLLQLLEQFHTRLRLFPARPECKCRMRLSASALCVCKVVSKSPPRLLWLYFHYRHKYTLCKIKSTFDSLCKYNSSAEKSMTKICIWWSLSH